MQITALSIPMREQKIAGMDTLGALVKRARLGKGMRGGDLGAAIGKDASYVSKIERGTMKDIPPPEIVRALSDALGVPEARLVRAIGYRTSEGEAPPFDFDSEKAAVLEILEGLDEREARTLRRMAEIIVDERGAQTVAAVEAFNRRALPDRPTT